MDGAGADTAAMNCLAAWKLACLSEVCCWAAKLQHAQDALHVLPHACKPEELV